MIVDGSGNPHSAEDGLGIGLVAKRAADIVQVFAYLAFAQVFDPCPVRHAIVPRHPRRLFEQRFEPAAGFGVHGLRADADPVLPARARRWSVRGAMRTIFAGRSPDDQNVAVVQDLGRQDGGIAWPQGSAAPPDPPLGLIDLVGTQSVWRSYGSALRLGDADDDVTAVEVLMIVRERADRLEYLEAGGIGIPARLELDPHRLDGAAAKEIVDVDRQDGAHAQIVAIAG